MISFNNVIANATTISNDHHLIIFARAYTLALFLLSRLATTGLRPAYFPIVLTDDDAETDYELGLLYAAMQQYYKAAEQFELVLSGKNAGVLNKVGKGKLSLQVRFLPFSPCCLFHLR